MLLGGTLVAAAFAAFFTAQQWLTAADQENRSLQAYLGITKFNFDRAKQIIEVLIAINYADSI
jgi:hypothetical protein